jgi:hypothetical protein
MVKNSEGSSVTLLACCSQYASVMSRTKSTLRYCTLLAILVVVRAQLVVAEDLVCFSDLLSYKPRYPYSNADVACTSRRRVAGV